MDESMLLFFQRSASNGGAFRSPYKCGQRALTVSTIVCASTPPPPRRPRTYCVYSHILIINPFVGLACQRANGAIVKTVGAELACQPKADTGPWNEAGKGDNPGLPSVRISHACLRNSGKRGRTVFSESVPTGAVRQLIPSAGEFGTNKSEPR